MTLLELSGIAHSYGAVRALDGVDLVVGAGEMVALIGPNGAGKSTCFGVASGQISADRGSVRLLSEEVTRLSVEARWQRGLGRTFQVARIFPSFSAIQNVQIALQASHRSASLFKNASGLELDRAAALLEELGLTATTLTPAGQLSYGDRKRLELAMVLAHDPRVILMDEPTAGLSPADRGALLALVSARVSERKCGVLFTEHDLASVFGFAQRVIVLVRGQILASGSAAEIRADARVREAYLGQGELA